MTEEEKFDNGQKDFVFPQEEDEISAETIAEQREVDFDFLQSGIDEEIEKANTKIEQGKEEHFGRTAFVSAHSKELGLDVRLSEETWSSMVAHGFNFKKEGNDAWGVAFTAGYLKEIDSEKFAELRPAFEEMLPAMGEELEKRIQAAKQDPKKWKEYFAMAEHLNNLAVNTLELDGLIIDTEVEEQLKACLEEYEHDPVGYLEVVNAIHASSPGTTGRITQDLGPLTSSIEAATALAEESKKKGDAWMYAHIMRNVKKAKTLL